MPKVFHNDHIVYDMNLRMDTQQLVHTDLSHRYTHRRSNIRQVERAMTPTVRYICLRIPTIECVKMAIECVTWAPSHLPIFARHSHMGLHGSTQYFSTMHNYIHDTVRWYEHM